MRNITVNVKQCCIKEAIKSAASTAITRVPAEFCMKHKQKAALVLPQAAPALLICRWRQKTKIHCNVLIRKEEMFTCRNIYCLQWLLQLKYPFRNHLS